MTQFKVFKCNSTILCLSLLCERRFWFFFRSPLVMCIYLPHDRNSTLRNITYWLYTMKIKDKQAPAHLHTIVVENYTREIPIECCEYFVRRERFVVLSILSYSGRDMSCIFFSNALCSAHCFLTFDVVNLCSSCYRNNNNGNKSNIL